MNENEIENDVESKKTVSTNFNDKETKGIPSPEEIQKEFSDIIKKKFGGNVQVMAMGPEIIEENDDHVEEQKQSHQEILDETLKNFSYRPKEIKKYLDRFVVGQDRAKKALSIAICDHYNHLKAQQQNQDFKHYQKQNVMLLGPTGVGKTYLVQLISELIGVPFVKADATRFSEVGYMGANVDDIIRDLVEKANGNKQLAEQGIVYVDEVDKLAGSSKGTGSRDVSGRGVQFGFLRLLENSDVDLNGSHDIASQFKNMMNFQKKGKAVKEVVNTKNILFIFSGAFHGLDKIVSERLHKKTIGINEKKAIETPEDLLVKATAADLVQFGFEHEFIGRLPVRVSCDNLNEKKLLKILKESEHSAIYQHQATFKHYGIDLSFTEESLMSIAKKAIDHKTGARALNSVLEEVLRPFKFELPSSEIKSLEVTDEVVCNPEGYLHHLLS